MAKKYNGTINFASALRPTGAQPLDDRIVVQSMTDLLSTSTFEANGASAAYNGMVVSVLDEQKVFMLVNAANLTSEESWVAVGSGNGSVAVETYSEAVALATNDNIGQVIYVKTKSSYDSDGEGDGEAVEYDAAPYIVIGANSLQKLAASTASGDIEGDVAELATKVSTLEGTVGDETNGLVKKVADLETAVDNLPETFVTDVKIGDTSVVEGGVATIDLSNYVEKDGDKVLSTNDYTTDEKTKLAGIAAGAEVNVVKSVDTEGALELDADGKLSVDLSDYVAKDGYVAYTTEEKTKLANIAEGAQVNKIEVVKVNGTALTIAEADKSVDVIIPTAPIQGVADGDKIISLVDKKLKSTLTLAYVPASEGNNAVLRLQGINGEVVSSIDATAFVKDGMLSNVKLDGPTGTETGDKYLVLEFNTDAGSDIIRLDVTELLDYYVAGDGLVLDGKTFKVKVDETANTYLQVTTNGIALSQTFWDKITELDNAVLAAAKKYTDDEITNLDLANTYEEKGAAAAVKNEINTTLESYAKSADVYSKTDADSTFVKSEGYVAYTTEEKTKLANIAEGAEVNVVKSVDTEGALGLDADGKLTVDLTDYATTQSLSDGLDGKLAKDATVNGVNFAENAVTIDGSHIAVGANIENENGEAVSAKTKVNTVLNSIFASLKGIKDGSYKGVTAANANGLTVNEVSNNTQTISINLEASSESTVAAGHISVKANESNELFAVMYWDGDDVEEITE